MRSFAGLIVAILLVSCSATPRPEPIPYVPLTNDAGECHGRDGGCAIRQVPETEQVILVVLRAAGAVVIEAEAADAGVSQ